MHLSFTYLLYFFLLFVNVFVWGRRHGEAIRWFSFHWSRPITYFIHTYQMFKVFMLISRKFFSQNIYNHILHVAIHQFNKLSLVFFRNK